MDIRIIKTKKAIREAFLSLRAHASLERIKVVELCALASINKTTFYKYYEDIYALNNEIETEVFAKFMHDFNRCDCLFSDPRSFIENLPVAMDAQGEIVNILFSDRYEAFFKRLEDDMTEYYLANHPASFSNAKVSFIICGTVHMFKELKESRRKDVSSLAADIASIIRALEN